jgi:hypothetical protein
VTVAGVLIRCNDCHTPAMTSAPTVPAARAELRDGSGWETARENGRVVDHCPTCVRARYGLVDVALSAQRRHRLAGAHR